MSSRLSSLLKSCRFYLSDPGPCPYLSGKTERKLFTLLPSGEEGDKIASFLAEGGFRRSETLLYRPVCEGCCACVPVRIAVESFTPTKTQRKLMRRNADLSVRLVRARATSEIFSLFRLYQQARHGGEMARMTFSELTRLLEMGPSTTFLLELRSGTGALLGAVLTDRTAAGFSAVYSFFDPRDKARSLGTQLILALIEETRRQRGSYVYLGFWIKACRKMAYKAGFHGLERLGQDGWIPFEEAGADKKTPGQEDPGASLETK